MHDHSVTVVGATNIDISVTSFSPILHGDSNPGRMRVGLGGVGRNVAENLARLGDTVRLITALGDDAYSDRCVQNAQALGMDISASMFVKHSPASVYVCVNEPDGDAYVAVSDMALCDLITPSFLQSRTAALDEASLIVAEANLSAEALDFLAQRYGEKLATDSVSERKAANLRRALPKIHTIKANRREASVLTGLSVETPEDDAAAANALHALGVRNVLLTRGKDGAFLSSDEQTMCMPSLVRDGINTTGCGDAFLAGFAHALLHGLGMRDRLAFALATAALCARSELAVSPDLSTNTVSEWLSQVKNGGVL